MVSRFGPGASGSGIPDVECQLRTGQFENPLPIVIVKFIGGLLAIGGGLVLGREGPTVQMSGSTARRHLSLVAWAWHPSLAHPRHRHAN